jgi:hypothetical protein
MKPGSDMSCDAASSLTACSPPLSRSRMPRRVGSASAANTESSCSSLYLTIGFSIGPRRCRVKQELNSGSEPEFVEIRVRAEFGL